MIRILSLQFSNLLHFNPLLLFSYCHCVLVFVIHLLTILHNLFLCFALIFVHICFTLVMLLYLLNCKCIVSLGYMVRMLFTFRDSIL